jgi:TFIIF-interacting CTD phosphatase-like protein
MYLEARYKFDFPDAYYKPEHPEIFSMFDEYRTRKRPGLQDFLNFCFENFNVGIWTIAEEKYTHEVLKNIKIKKEDIFLLKTRTDCFYRSDIKTWLKPINTLQDNIIMIDDKPHQIDAKPNDKILPIKPYYGSDDDDELYKMMKNLENLI